jgi:hypothetical protein
MKTEQPILITTVNIAGSYFGAPITFSKNTFCGIDGGLTATADPSLGVIYENHTLETVADTHQLPVIVSGIALVKSGAAVAAGVALEKDNSGRVIAQTTGYLVGVSLDEATGANELIRVLIK